MGFNMYFNIQRYSTHDGDGIRSILFLKGCSLSCRWCQNPESHSDKPSLLYDQRFCVKSCDLCVKASDNIVKSNGKIIINRKEISAKNIMDLQDVCPTQALTVCGKKAGEDELFTILMKDKTFYDHSSGGVTFSGGEPLMQPQLVTSLSQRLKKKNVSVAIESCMHVPWKNIEQVAPYVDCWLVDLKHSNDEKFLTWTKGSLTRIKSNLKKLSAIANRIVIRVPVVPDFNDSDQELKEIIDFAASLANCTELHLLPYHTLGINKYNLLDIPYECSDKPLNNDGLLQRAQQYSQEQTPLNVIIRG